MSNSLNMSEELFYMIKARDALTKIPKSHQSEHFIKIYNDIQNFIFLNCSHFYINDYIDYTPERSGCITYCCKCLLSEDFLDK